VNIDDDADMPTPLSALRGCGRRLLSLAMLAIVPLILLYIFGFSIKTSEEYACALDTAERNAQVIRITGEPVKPGLFAWIFYFESGGGERQGNFSTSLSGPRGKGTLKVQFYRTPLGPHWASGSKQAKVRPRFTTAHIRVPSHKEYR
jgi:hypothetical protein